MNNRPINGLVLPGGGARGAYQVGVLKAIASLAPKGSANPFPIISGTSAGAVNASVIAANAQSFDKAINKLDDVWGNFKSNQVYKTDNLTMLKSSLHWLISIVLGGYPFGAPKSLLDNTPLKKLLESHIDFTNIQKNIDKNLIRAIGITAAGYTSQCSTSFFQTSMRIDKWTRTRRRGVKCNVTIDHLMGSLAIPMIFPQIKINGEYFGDGAMRQSTPLSPAIHLGADRILVIGVRNQKIESINKNTQSDYPSFANISGYVLDTLFMDGLYSDLERLISVNKLIDSRGDIYSEGSNPKMRAIDTMIINPTKSLTDIAHESRLSMPRSIRIILRGISGKDNSSASRLLSFLLFEAQYTKKLIDLGYRDAMAVEKELSDFINGKNIPRFVNSG
ncbi:patatin-like phospholipase family protein [Woeseiaceae bacterium]|jgi:NTE family protein|nr:patatin-like phospholipase family protein [Woeseiaceae bacterium]